MAALGNALLVGFVMYQSQGMLSHERKLFLGCVVAIVMGVFERASEHEKGHVGRV